MKQFLNKILGFFTLKEDEYDDYDDYEDEDYEEDLEEEAKPKKLFGRKKAEQEYSDDITEAVSEPVKTEAPKPVERNASTPKQTYRKASPVNHGGTSVFYFRPQRLNDARAAADCVINGHVVLINFAGADLQEGQRIIDFLTGTTYALDGNLQKINDSIFIITGKNITITKKEPAASWNPNQW